MGGLQAALEQWLADMPAEEWAALKARVRGPEDFSETMNPPRFLWFCAQATIDDEVIGKVK